MVQIAKPFLKWAGGKRQLLPHLLPKCERIEGAYREPFLGGGALFFALAPRRATLCDSNLVLVRAYRGVRDSVELVIRALQNYKAHHCKEFYYAMRGEEFPSSDAECAARLIYLNRTCFNGLWRVNKSGRFNVPFGDYANPKILDEENLYECAAALQNQVIAHADFSHVSVERGDLVYLDPPYIPLSATSSFTAYTEGGFGDAEQLRLRVFADQCKAVGARVVASNSGAPRAREIWDGWKIEEVEAKRRISCKGDERKNVREVIIT